MKKTHAGRLTSPLRMTRRPTTTTTLSSSESSASSESPNYSANKSRAFASLKHSLSTSREGVEVELHPQPQLQQQSQPPTTDDTDGSKVTVEKSRRWWRSETPSIRPAVTATETADDDDGTIAQDMTSNQVAVVAPLRSSPRRAQKPYHPASRKYGASVVLEIAAFVSGLLSAALHRAQIDHIDLFEENVDFLLWGVVLGWASTIFFAVAVTLAWRAAVAYRKMNAPVGGTRTGGVVWAQAPAAEGVSGGLERGGSRPFMVTSWMFSAVGIGTYVILSALFTSFQVRPLWIAVLTIVDAAAFLLMFLHARAARRRMCISCNYCGG